MVVGKFLGDEHPVLKKDFAVAFMNSTMERILKEYGKKIICMDGTHGTNRRGLDLTIILVKDDRNIGFPVAFLVSNRLDQSIQEVFLGALRDKVGEEFLEPQYFMSDDDAKYYNAWVKTMENNQKPRRLLCSWHIRKNWNIQGRNKIKGPEIRKTMKMDLKKILNETKPDKFMELCNQYFLKLETAGENEFLSYLKKYYFQNEERISMWAHCCRINAGINTNMALESFNNILKTNQMERQSNHTVEKLLDNLEDLVDQKMWRRILNTERPTSNTYPNQVTIKAHKAAEKMDRNMISEVGFGEFKVNSNNNIYNVSYNELCESACRYMYCTICKICIHRYKCECPQYAVRITICKHVHLVCLYERGRDTNSVLDNVMDAISKESSEIQTHHKAEVQEFIEERIVNASEVKQHDEETIRRIIIEKRANNLRAHEEKETG